MNALPAQPSPAVNGLISRRATAADADAIVALVNSAYRGETSRAGWTTEADMLGGQRTDAREIAHLIAADDSAILLALQDGEIVGSVHVERVDAATAYLGMLVIRPVLQGRGLAAASWKRRSAMCVQSGALPVCRCR